MNTLFNQMLSAVEDLENGQNAPHAANFIKVAVTILRAQNELTLDIVQDADETLTETLEKNDKFVALHRAAHAFGHDCRQALSDRKELLEVAGKSLGMVSDENDDIEDLLRNLFKGLGGNVKVVNLSDLMNKDDVLEKAFEQLFSQQEKPKYN